MLQDLFSRWFSKGIQLWRNNGELLVGLKNCLYIFFRFSWILRVLKPLWALVLLSKALKAADMRTCKSFMPWNRDPEMWLNLTMVDILELRPTISVEHSLGLPPASSKRLAGFTKFVYWRFIFSISGLEAPRGHSFALVVLVCLVVDNAYPIKLYSKFNRFSHSWC